MTDLDLRPLSLGEILDRAFSLYRSRFLLFVGISAIPQVFSLAISLFSILQPRQTATLSVTFLLVNGRPLAVELFSLFYLVVLGLVYLFSQGATTLAVSELYLGRSVSVAESLRRVWDDLGFLFGAVALNGLAVGAASILFIIPGVYVACRLLICVPVALIEKRAPRESLSRSWALTRGAAGRAFLILLLSGILTYAATVLFALPFSIPLAGALGDPAMTRFWTLMTQVGSSIATVLVSPISLIAISIYYYDLRVRKEAFDIQFMMNPDAVRPPGSGMPSILS